MAKVTKQRGRMRRWAMVYKSFIKEELGAGRLRDESVRRMADEALGEGQLWHQNYRQRKKTRKD